jgi:hypothetical protein
MFDRGPFCRSVRKLFGDDLHQGGGKGGGEVEGEKGGKEGRKLGKGKETGEALFFPWLVNNGGNR